MYRDEGHSHVADLCKDFLDRVSGDREREVADKDLEWRGSVSVV
jgi:hypothetical protein